MNARPAHDPTFGYLACSGTTSEGVTGGYLIVSATGRPLEFHCTAPVVANRAQEILFGPTLRPYVLGEQIGQTLVAKSKLKPDLLLVNDLDAAGAGKPVVVVATEDDSTSLGVRIAASPVAWKRIGDSETMVWASADDDRVAALIERLAASIDIAEPFDRITQAIGEVQRLGQGEAVDRDAA